MSSAERTFDLEAALVIPVPEAEPWIGDLREQHDPAAALGVPAHITVNYPFVPGVDPDAHLLKRLTVLFASVEPFPFQLTRISRFPDVLYLAPEPTAPLVALIDRIAQRFPESPPYGGKFDTPIPHLTVAQSDDPKVLVEVERRLAARLEPVLPLPTAAVTIWLMDNQAGRWGCRRRFGLGEAGRAASKGRP